jgi:hypothetical protein
MTEKSFFAGFGGAQESTRTGERVTANYSSTACLPINIIVREKVTGGRK